MFTVIVQIWLSVRAKKKNENYCGEPYPLKCNYVTRQVEYHHLLVKARKFHKAVTDIEHYELETAAKNRGGGKLLT